MLPIPNAHAQRRRLFIVADRIIVNSYAELRQIDQVYGPFPKTKYCLVPNAIEDDFAVLPDEDRLQFCRQFGLMPGYLLSVGFQDERKNSLRLIEGFLRSGVSQKLVLVGGNRYRNPAKARALDELVAANPERILRIPFIDRASPLLKSAYANAQAHLLVSHLETPGLSSLEAAAFGKPLLLGDCPPVREYFGDAATYVDPRSRAEIARGVASVASEPGREVPTVRPLSDSIALLVELYRALASG